MSPLTITCIAFACIAGGALVGMLAARRLPEHHLTGESKDIIKVSLALISTLTGMVLGLLVASAKGTYDAQSGSVKQMAADLVLLDRVLTRYGPETKEAQEILRHAATMVRNELWPDDGTRADLASGAARGDVEAFYEKVAELSPKNNMQRTLQGRALDLTLDVSKSRVRLFAQRNRSIPLPLVQVLVFWLATAFAGYGLMAPRNATVVAVLLIGILSVSAALFIVLELDSPFGGFLQIPSTPLNDAIAQLGQ